MTENVKPFSPEFAEALSAMQADLPTAEFDKVNPAFGRFKYASLGSLIKATRPVLTAHGFAIVQLVSSNGETVAVTSVLSLKGCEYYLHTTMEMPINFEASNPVQAMGSVITYMRRYQYSALVGIYADEDDDGNSADEVSKPKAKQQPPPMKGGQSPKATEKKSSRPFKPETMINYFNLKAGEVPEEKYLPDDQMIDLVDELDFKAGEYAKPLKAWLGLGKNKGFDFVVWSWYFNCVTDHQAELRDQELKAVIDMLIEIDTASEIE